jgi:hypothetical protein
MNAWLAKPIPLGLVYCDRCRAFGDTQLDAGRLFAGCGGTGFMQILGRGDRRRATIGRYIDTGQADFFLRCTISFRRPTSLPFSDLSAAAAGRKKPARPFNASGTTTSISPRDLLYFWSMGSTGRSWPEGRLCRISLF